jgi:hypothetical protein
MPYTRYKLTTSNYTSANKIVSASVVKSLMEGSNEHIGLLLDKAISESAHLFNEGDASLSRVATFNDRVIVGSLNGDLFKVVFENKDNRVLLSKPEKMTVPAVSSLNSVKSVKELSLNIVDSLMSEDSKSVAKKMLSLLELQEQPQAAEPTDYPAEAVALVSSGRPWRHIFESQWAEINNQISSKIESIAELALEAKYKPLYESDDIPEENFESYRKLAEEDLSTLVGRLTAVHDLVESEYLPFVDTLDKNELSESEEEVLSHFCFFSEDLIEDLKETISLVSNTLENEQCVMCLGQVYDTIAESLTSCEIAASFVQHMVGTLVDAT